MGLIGVVLLASVLATTSWPAPASACMCQEAHPQQLICRADFVILAKVMHAQQEGFNVRYHVAIKRMFKGSARTRSLIKQAGIVSARDEALCGVGLTQQQLYLLAGRVGAGGGGGGGGKQPRVGLCDFTAPWVQLSVRQRKGVRLQYHTACDCEPHMCPSTTWEGCYARHSVCARSQNGSCEWLQGRELSACLRAEANADAQEFLEP